MLKARLPNSTSQPAHATEEWPFCPGVLGGLGCFHSCAKEISPRALCGAGPFSLQDGAQPHWEVRDFPWWLKALD